MASTAKDGINDLEAEQVRAIKQLVNIRMGGEGDRPLFGAERVDVELVGQYNGPFRVKKNDFAFIIDEPIERGGSNTAANPLAYFLGGAAGCLMSQWMIWATAKNIDIESFVINAIGHFDRRLVHGYFKEIIYEARIESKLSDKFVFEDLAKQAQEMCYAHNTLARAGVKMVTNVYLNGSFLKTLIA